MTQGSDVRLVWAIIACCLFVFWCFVGGGLAILVLSR